MELSKVLEIVNQRHPIGYEFSNPNDRDSYGEAPLHYAAIWNEPELIAVLVEHGADIDQKGEDDYTPLQLAAQQNSLEAIKVLISFKPKNSLTKYFPDTAKGIAKTLGHMRVYDYLDQQGY